MFCILAGSNSVQGPSEAEKGFYHGFILEPFLLLVPLMKDITFLEHILKVLMFFLFFFLSQSLSSLLHAESPIHAKSTLVRTEASARRSPAQPRSSAPVRRDSAGRSVSAVRSRLPRRPSKQPHYFPFVWSNVFSLQCLKRCLTPPQQQQQQTGCCVLVVVVIELWVSLWSSLSVSRQPKKPETNHPVFQTLISALITVIISEDVQTSWIKVKKFQLCCTDFSVLTFPPTPHPPPHPHASCVLFRKVLWNHTPPLLWRRRVLGPNTPPERGAVHVRGRGNQVRQSPLHE